MALNFLETAQDIWRLYSLNLQTFCDSVWQSHTHSTRAPAHLYDKGFELVEFGPLQDGAEGHDRGIPVAPVGVFDVLFDEGQDVRDDVILAAGRQQHQTHAGCLAWVPVIIVVIFILKEGGAKWRSCLDPTPAERATDCALLTACDFLYIHLAVFHHHRKELPPLHEKKCEFKLTCKLSLISKSQFRRGTKSLIDSKRSMNNTTVSKIKNELKSFRRNKRQITLEICKSQ